MRSTEMNCPKCNKPMKESEWYNDLFICWGCDYCEIKKY